MLGWPTDQEVILLGSVTATKETTVEMVGYNSGNLSFTAESGGLYVNLPPFFKVLHACPSCIWGSVLKLNNVHPTRFDYDEVRVELV